ncbi:MAG: hypothetical protein PVI86_12975, partial [Phycisphaerae bacterium]
MVSGVERLMLGRTFIQVLVVALSICSWVTGSDESGVPADAAFVEGVRIDGAAIRGHFLGSEDGQRVQVQTEAGVQSIPIDGFLSLSFGTRPGDPDRVGTGTVRTGPGVDPGAPVGASGRAVVYLADGGRIGCVLGDQAGESDSLSCETALGHADIPFDRLAGVELATRDRFPRAAELFEAALDDRLP